MDPTLGHTDSGSSGTRGPKEHVDMRILHSFGRRKTTIGSSYVYVVSGTRRYRENEPGGRFRCQAASRCRRVRSKVDPMIL